MSENKLTPRLLKAELYFFTFFNLENLLNAFSNSILNFSKSVSLIFDNFWHNLISVSYTHLIIEDKKRIERLSRFENKKIKKINENEL